MRSSVRFFLLLLLLIVLCGILPAAQNSSSPSGSPQNPNDSAGQQQQQQPDQSKDKKKKKDKDKDKKDKDKDKKDKGPQDVYNTEVFSAAVANNVLNDLRDGLEGHTPRLMLSAFDADKMDGYLEFEDQIEAFFSRYQAFSVHFRIAQSSTEGPKGIVLVDIQLEEIPRGATAPPQRKNGQIRFELERGKKGWKIVDFNPRNFFS